MFLLSVLLLASLHAVAGGPAASVPADPGVHILAGGFTYWIVFMRLRYYTIRQSDYGYRTVIFFCYQTIGLSDQGLNLSDYRISDSEKTSGCHECPPLVFRSCQCPIAVLLLYILCVLGFI